MTHETFNARLAQRTLVGLDGQILNPTDVIAAAQVYAILDLAAAIRETRESK